MKYIIVNEAGQILHRYEAAEPQVFGYLWMPPIAEHREVPEGVCHECAAIVDGQVVEDATLHAAKVQRQWDTLRSIRNARLTACDWTQIADCPLSPTMKANWATYRQQLRDLPENTVDPASPAWPSEPVA